MPIKVLRMADLDLRSKRVLIREDLNVPVQSQQVTSDARIRAGLPDDRGARRRGARVMVMSHLGRPEEGVYDPEFSLAPVACATLRAPGRQRCASVRDWLDGVDCEAGEVVLLENVRSTRGEKKNHAELARRMAALCDVFVMDAFATAHRAEAVRTASRVRAPSLARGRSSPASSRRWRRRSMRPSDRWSPSSARSKVSTKLTVLENLLGKVDQLIVGGGIANTFLAAAGHPIGKVVARGGHGRGRARAACAVAEFEGRRSRCRPMSWSPGSSPHLPRPT